MTDNLIRVEPRGDIRPSHVNRIVDWLRDRVPTYDEIPPLGQARGALDSTGELPSGGNTTGDWFAVNGTIWMWSGTEWTNQGALRGPQGERGYTGPQGPAGTDGDLDAAVGAATSGQTLGAGPITSAPMWQARRYIVVDDVLADGGTIQDALDLVPASGADVVFRADGSSYTVPNAGIFVHKGTRIVPTGSRAAVLTAPSGATGPGVLNVTGWDAPSVRIEGLEIDCDDHATMTTGIYVIANQTDPWDIHLTDLVIRNALGKGIWCWKTAGTTVTNVAVHDSGVGMQFDDIQHPVRLVNPTIINAVAGRMSYGILTGIGGSNAVGHVEIIAPHIVGADYPSTNGADAHGILITNSRAHIVGGTISGCGNPANTEGGGIVLGVGSQHSIIDGTIIHDNHATGLWVETRPSTDFTLGADRISNGSRINNVQLLNNRSGSSISYGAGTTLTNCTAMGNEVYGFVTDSEDVTFVGCTAANNWTDGTAGHFHHDGVKAGFHLIKGSGMRDAYAGGMFGCSSYDNQSTQTQEYGLAMEVAGYRIIGCNLSNNDIGGIYESGTGTANTKVGNT